MTSRLDLDDVLASARSAAQPEAGEAARVRERLTVPSLAAAPSGAALPSTALNSAALSSRKLAQLGVWSVGAIGLFLAGFLLGRSSVQTAAAPALPAPLQVSSNDAPAEVAAKAEADVEADVPTEAGRAAPKAITPSGAKSARLRTRQPAHATDLHEVVRRLREAQRAARAGDGARSLAVLDELDRRVARALLAEERQVTRVLALCSADQPERARRLAREVLSAHPGSVYSARLEHSCAELQRDEALLEAIRQRVRE